MLFLRSLAFAYARNFKIPTPKLVKNALLASNKARIQKAVYSYCYFQIVLQLAEFVHYGMGESHPKQDKYECVGLHLPRKIGFL